MPSLQRLRDEMAFHDHQARERWQHLQSQSLNFDAENYLDHEPWIRPALDFLEPVAGLATLDLGCGHGMAAVVLAQRGAVVTGVDLSLGYLHEARARSEAHQLSLRWLQANGEQLPFPDQSFDRIWGNAILHHLDLAQVGREIVRVLKPGGRAVFCEPWRGNPLLAFARRFLPYPGKHRTRDECPLGPADLPTLRKTFPQLEVEGYQLLGMAGKLLGYDRLRRGLGRLDQSLLHRVPVLQRYCRYVVLKITR